jgi:hypothetical protein
MIFESTYEVRQGLKGAAIVKGDRVEVVDVAKLQAGPIDLARSGFWLRRGSPVLRWMIWEIGQTCVGAAASIHEFYIARGSIVVELTVPAMNIASPMTRRAQAARRTMPARSLRSPAAR